MSENSAPRRAIPWWSLLMTGTPLLLAILTVSVRLPGAQGGTHLALASLAAVITSWWLIGRLHASRRWAGVIHLAIFTVAMVSMMFACPPLAFIQALYFPFLWEVTRNPRWSSILSVLVGTVPALLLLPFDPEYVPIALGMGLSSAAVSIGIGWSFVLAEQKTQEREKLFQALEATQREREELSQLRGVAAERERMSRELHDTIAQSLIGAVMLSDRGVRTAEKLTGHVDAEAQATLAQHREQLTILAASLRDTLAETRAIIAETAPVTESDSGTRFDDTLARLVERFRRETSIGISLSSELSDMTLDRERQVVLLRVVQEGLSNVRRHSRAEHTELAVSMSRDGGDGEERILLHLSDDGVGFSPDEHSSGFGLPGLRGRVRALGGCFAVDAAPGAGTRLTVTLPTKDHHG